MQVKEIADAVTRLYLYGVSTKFIHYSNKGSHTHEQCDELKEHIDDFADELAESTFGYIGKPTFSNFSIDQEISSCKDIRDICDRCEGVVAPIRTECDKDDKMSGIVSLIDDFLAYLGKAKFLATFDKFSGQNE